MFTYMCKSLQKKIQLSFQKTQLTKEQLVTAVKVMWTTLKQ